MIWIVYVRHGLQFAQSKTGHFNRSEIKNMVETIEQIKIDEGYRAEPYLCSEGKLTWLYGRNIEDRPITDNEWKKLIMLLSSGLNLKDWAGELFNYEIKILKKSLNGYAVYISHYPEEVGVIVLNMAYNMGLSRFNPKKWPKFFKAIREHDYEEAAKQMKNSKWYRQVGNRSRRLVDSMLRISREVK